MGGNVNCLWRRHHNLYSLYHNHHCLWRTISSTCIMDNNKVKKHKNSKSGSPSPSFKPNAEPLTSNSNSDLNSDPISDQFPTNSGSQAPLTPKQTDLDNPLQILPDETLQSSRLVRFVEGLDLKLDFVLNFCPM